MASPDFEEEKGDEEENTKGDRGIDINQCLKLFTEEEMLGEFGVELIFIY